MIRPELTVNTEVSVILSLTLQFLYTVVLVRKATVFLTVHTEHSLNECRIRYTVLLEL